MKEKYIEERHPRWMSMCLSRDDICTIDKDLGRSPDALAIINEHNELLDAFIMLAQAFDRADHEAFKEYWYA